MNSVGSRIRYLRKELGLTQAAFAELLDVATRGAVGNWERNQGIKTENLQHIAMRTKSSFEWLATGRGDPPAKLELLEAADFFLARRKVKARTHDLKVRVAPHASGVRVLGEVAAGNWVDPETPEEVEVPNLYVPFDQRYPPVYQFALIVRGKSIEKYARDGQALVCVSVGGGSPVEPRNGDIVIAERTRAQGGLVERTAKLLRINGAHRELVPQYLDDRLNEPLRLKGDRDNEDIEVRVLAVVIGVYSPLRNLS